MKTKKSASTVILLLVPLLLYACATAKSHYADARKINTVSAYQEFLETYPSGKYAELAQNQIEALHFEKAQAVNTVEAYENFMRSSDSDLFKSYAVQRIQKIHKDEYSKAQKIDSIEAYSSYATQYPQSEFVPNCLERIEYLEWSATLKRHDAVGYYKYLHNCKACGKHKQEARRRFSDAVKAGTRIDLSVIQHNVEHILRRSDIVTRQSISGQISKKAGPVALKNLSAADEVLVSILKGKKSIDAADLKKGNYASVKTLRLKHRVPLSQENTIGFSTVMQYSKKSGTTTILFIEDGSGYLFKEPDLNIY